MKMKLYYGAIALLWLLSSCEMEGTPIMDSNNQVMYNTATKVSIDGHEYFTLDRGIAHSGSCKQCKHELDSIVKNAVNEAFEKYGKEDWNE